MGNSSPLSADTNNICLAGQIANHPELPFLPVLSTQRGIFVWIFIDDLRALSRVAPVVTTGTKQDHRRAD